MDKLYWLEEIELQDYAKVGDKALNLSKAIQRGYPVIPGFVVGVGVLREFLETLSSSEALVADLPHSSLRLDVGNWRQLQQVARSLRQEIIAATIPQNWLDQILAAVEDWDSKHLIFRPTFVLPTKINFGKNISGLLESQVCLRDRTLIETTLKQVWSQLFRARSLLYWQRLGIDMSQINLAVLVQPIENAIASGSLVANSEICEIHGTFGLGFPLNYGEIIPDYYKVSCRDGIILERQLGKKILGYQLDYNSLSPYLINQELNHQFSLSNDDCQQLVSLTKKIPIPDHTNFRFDWTILQHRGKDIVYLTQALFPQTAANLHLICQGLGVARGVVTAPVHVITRHQETISELTPGVILVATVIVPEWLPLLHSCSGIITERGGFTSHAAILARELGIPAVVNVSGATNIIHSGDRLLINGDSGEIFSIKKGSHGEPSMERLEPGVHSISELDVADLARDNSVVPLGNVYPTIATKLFVNLSQPSSLKTIENLPIDGVGLLRSELMTVGLLEGKSPQSWLDEGRERELIERWYQQLLLFVKAFAPRPIFYRSLDLQSNGIQLTRSHDESQHSNQGILGERGTLGYLQNSAVFEVELAALGKLQQNGYHNINLILPFVRSVEEFRFCRRRIEQAGLMDVSQFQLWIMAEVPSVLFLLSEYVKAGVQGIAIGSNDLTQLLLGIDREKSKPTRTLDERHPAVMNAIAQLIQMAQNENIPCSICGQAPSLYPEIIDSLVRWGITSISVEPNSIPQTYHAIARAEQRIILNAARRQMM
ncbi:putative PEP-binding protein [Calothrix sp. PCC 6303]|uniref:putative PEP-binding protein n=1 Tax=Calothrix sp. PCC 6303 TaxID=1170562 RepID=UPI0002A03E19|nr:putative PEP-binding protein [Calothrix sp. PCC 6303]AFY99979.1 phosphoenolpyruvate synthase [Calothrix sp. PCC 6303]